MTVPHSLSLGDIWGGFSTRHFKLILVFFFEMIPEITLDASPSQFSRLTCAQLITVHELMPNDSQHNHVS